MGSQIFKLLVLYNALLTAKIAAQDGLFKRRAPGTTAEARRGGRGSA